MGLRHRLDRRPPPTSADWPAIAAAAARLADAPTDGLQPLAWPDGLDDSRVVEVLGQELHADLSARAAAAAQTFRTLFGEGPLVLAHTDLQPANALCDNSGAWLIDMEYAALAPREWDPAKLAVLANRFGEPATSKRLIELRPRIDDERLRRCVAIQEVLLVVWLTRMASATDSDVGREARRRATSLSSRNAAWEHLR